MGLGYEQALLSATISSFIQNASPTLLIIIGVIAVAVALTILSWYSEK